MGVIHTTPRLQASRPQATQARWRWTADKAPRRIAFQVALRGVRPGLQRRAARAILNETLRLRHRPLATRG